ncbi:MAG: hypothetical protein ACRYFU_01065 [Janthinobacterium lividum]
MQTTYHSVQAPVERREDRLVLRIPMDAGGDKLQLVARASSFVEGDDLVVLLPEWLAQRMRLAEGSEVHLDDRWGKLNIARVN